MDEFPLLGAFRSLISLRAMGSTMVVTPSARGSRCVARNLIVGVRRAVLSGGVARGGIVNLPLACRLSAPLRSM